jgi:hypothetical protein
MTISAPVTAHFESVELRDCLLDGIRGAAHLRGVCMSLSDVLSSAGVFAGACGVRILPPRRFVDRTAPATPAPAT